MLRIVHLAILPGVLLTACAVWVNADTVEGRAVAGKQMYSNRPAGYTVPSPYYGTPMAPRFVSPTAVPYRVTVVQGTRSPQVVAPVTAVPVQVPEFAPTVPVPMFPSTSATSGQQAGERTIVIQPPKQEVSVNDELDVFYARLAKLQLEKHELDTALALVQNIKSETFKVRTVVDLAEYVARDKSYQSEAEKLYRLAIAGMDALDRKQPFRIDTSAPVAPAPVPLPPEVIPTPPVDVPDTTITPRPIPINDPPPVPDPPAPPQTEDTGQNGITMPLAPDPPLDERSGLEVAPPVNPPPTDEAPPVSRDQERPIITPGGRIPLGPPLDDNSGPPSVSTNTPKPDTIVRPKPIVNLDDEEPETTKRPTVQPLVRPLRPPIVLDEN